MDEKLFPNTVWVLNWIEEQKKLGLADIKFDASPQIGSTLESFSKDFRGMILAKTIEDNNLD